MRDVSRILALAAVVLALVAAATVLGWKSSPSSAVSDIQTSFEENDSSSESAPQQQVTASWAIKDATLLVAVELRSVSSRLSTITLLLAAITAASVSIALGGSSKVDPATYGAASLATTPAGSPPATTSIGGVTVCRFCGERTPSDEPNCKWCKRRLEDAVEASPST